MSLNENDPAAGAARDQVWAQMKEYRDLMQTVACASNAQIARMLKTDGQHTQIYRILAQIALTELDIIRSDIGLPDDEEISPGYRRLADMCEEQTADSAEREAVQIAQTVLGECCDEADDITDNEFIESIFYNRLKEELSRYIGFEKGSPKGDIARALESWVWLSESQARFQRAVEIVLSHSSRGEEWTVKKIVSKIKREAG